MFEAAAAVFKCTNEHEWQGWNERGIKILRNNEYLGNVFRCKHKRYMTLGGYGFTAQLYNGNMSQY